ncbi:heavy metal translocating P-type ATPase [Methylibium sp.]|uniref:heavy metal translocating P-type ATPase n=1 Tax=Methylibium sp. TaxID=2067992 RepID=UPI003D0C7BD3
MTPMPATSLPFPATRSLAAHAPDGAADLSGRQRAALDDEAALAACTTWQNGADGQREARTRLLLQGLHCAACAGIIEAALLRIEGVRSAQVNAAAERAEVCWDPLRTRASVLIDAVQRAGYQAYLADAQDALRARQAESRAALWRLFVAAFCMMQVMMAAAPSYFAAPGDIAPDIAALLRWSAWVLTLPVLLFSAQPFFAGAWHALRQRRVGMDVPVALGIVVTFVASSAASFDPGGPFGHEVYFDSLTMFVCFLLAGRWLEARSRERSTRSLDALLRRLPDSVERLAADGSVAWVPVARLVAGDRVRVAAGQAFPGDGLMIEGRTEADESLLTGESRPLPRGAGDAVIAGSLNLVAPVVVQLTQVGTGTRHQQIVDLMQRALAERPTLMRAADRIAAPFVVGVLLLSGLAFWAWLQIEPARAVWVAVSILIVTCPCALSLAAPSALIAAAGALARRGVLVQRLDALEALAHVDVACFDKTGTLTEDRLALAHIELPAGADRSAWLARAATLAAHSHHPLSVALVRAVAHAGAEARTWRDVREHAGQGLEACDADGRRWRLGAAAWVGALAPEGLARPAVWLAPQDAGVGAEVARFEFDEALRPDATALLQSLRAQGLDLRLLSGDRAGAVQAVARRLGLTQALHGAAPQDKLAALRGLQREGHRVLMVGDGLNDGPVLAQADVSIALGHGAALAQQRADFVVLGSRLGEIAHACELARRCARIVRQNLAWAVAYNAVCVPLALLGWLPPWAAGLGMALSSLVVVGNALRLAR